MVLEPGQHAPLARLELDLDRDVADQPRPVRADRHEIDQSDAGQRLLAELVGVAEQLIAAAHREDHAPRAAAACSASRLTSARSSAHSRWSRSWPPPM